VAPEDLGDAVRGARAMGWAGFNCSIPHKVSVIDHIDKLGKSAEVIGAVNTVVNRNGTLTGENTDGRGFADLIAERLDLSGKKLVVLGAGGAARAVSVELALGGVSDILIVNRSRERASELVALLNDKTPATAEYASWQPSFQLPPDTDILFNATPVGMFPDVDGKLDVDHTTLGDTMFVAEGVTNPPETHLLKMAKSKGCRSLSGMEMLVSVCAICVKMWTGQDTDKAVMARALREALELPPS
ncbi:MAG: shikimate dehydrogenase, partial [Hyphomicrobiales bacterium]|nr:shikimate dehydrogenase [Hyphomicrobiales bacterium]